MFAVFLKCTLAVVSGHGCVLSGEAKNIDCIVIGLTCLVLKPRSIALEASILTITPPMRPKIYHLYCKWKCPISLIEITMISVLIIKTINSNEFKNLTISEHNMIVSYIP